MQEIIQRHELRRKVGEEELLLRFETKPGQQMQIDWVEFPKDGFSAFVATMGYSRASYVEYVRAVKQTTTACRLQTRNRKRCAYHRWWDEKIETLINYHMNAFAYFGGVPSEGLYNNMKTVIIKRNAYGPDKHKFNEQFRDFAKHCGI